MKFSSLHRRGLSLVEVLIAIFVLAIGLLGVLSLFPLAAVNMANAIKDENTAQLNQSATANFRVIWKEETPGPAADLYPEYPPLGAGPPVPATPHNHYDPLFNAMTNVNYPHNPDLLPSPQATITTPSALPALALNSPSCYPVYIDPVGWNNAFNKGTPQQFWLGGNESTGLVSGSGYMTIPRRSLRRLEYIRSSVPGPTGPPYLYQTAANPVSLNVEINRLCFRLDDIGFGKDGTPYDDTGDLINNTSGQLGALNGTVQRDGRYSCAFLVKRQNRTQAREARLTVVVYNARSVDGPSDENAYRTWFFKDQTEAWLDYSGLSTKPSLHKGNWILDATMTLPNGQPDLKGGGPHGYFYRIVNISDDPAAQRLVLELQTPAIESTYQADGSTNGPGLGIVMPNVVEVFERGLLTPFTRPVP